VLKLGIDAGWIKFGYTPDQASAWRAEAKSGKLTCYEQGAEVSNRLKSGVWIESRESS
jgi:hypothetical protein